jgi:hypothetical protein
MVVLLDEIEAHVGIILPSDVKKPRTLKKDFDNLIFKGKPLVFV